MPPLRIKEAILAYLQSGLGGTTKHLHVSIHPGHHIAWHVRGAVCHAGDVYWTEDAIPHVEVAQLSHKGLSCIKSSSYNVLCYKNDRLYTYLVTAG